MFSKILIANRGEIACRVIQTAKKMGVKTVAVYSEADQNALHVQMADEAVLIGKAPVAESYLKGDVIIKAALKTSAEAIHPGYGFLSENPEFVEAVEAANLTFVGPSAEAIHKMGLKDAAKKLMEEANVPVVPGYHGESQDAEFLAEQAEKIGYPVLIKARAGGGGKGMRKVDDPADFKSALESAQREGQASFGDPHVLIEKFITAPRHIEVQVFGDTKGNVVHLFERDCSLQRRHQKVIEEAPAPGMTSEMRDAMTSAAKNAAKAIDYTGAGTIEFIVDGSSDLSVDGFWFMEMNTRLQVEHPVTEAITGTDLVEWQLRVAAGEALPKSQDELHINGHAFEARVYAEDANNNFLPVTGKVHHIEFGDARIDTAVESGSEISPHYDPMIAKLTTHGKNREEALSKLNKALTNTHVAGTITNVSFLISLCNHKDFGNGIVDTGLIERDMETLIAKEEMPELVFALAALEALKLDLTKAQTGWRLWGEASHKITLITGEEKITKTIILNDNQSLSVLEDDKAPLRLDNIARLNNEITATLREQTEDASTETKQITADVVSYKNADFTNSISVLYEGVTFLFLHPDPLTQAGSDESSSNALKSPMTGVISQIKVAVGDAVKAGDRLGVIEAMKMEHSLIAPRDCVIAEWLCAEGSSVESGAVLVRFEEDEQE